MKFATLAHVTPFVIYTAVSAAVTTPKNTADDAQTTRRRLRIGEFKSNSAPTPISATDTTGHSKCADIAGLELKDSLVTFRNRTSEGDTASSFPNIPCGVDTIESSKIEDIQCEFYSEKGNKNIEYACLKSKRPVGPFLDFALSDTATLFQRKEHLCALKGFKLAKNSPSSWYWGCIPCDDFEEDYDSLCN
mmetsp:Transcript_14042/g.21919  ORF Transcript_14042/g.21919 Transcript_14042/m.21919 type:complete len:191 (+) Transcript_14042:89-661(+)